MTPKEKLVEILSVTIHSREGADAASVVADYLVDNNVVPVVRCRDCRFGKPDILVDDVVMCDVHMHSMICNDYCSYGERKGEASE